MDYTELMWSALEGALGNEKTAWLRNAPLSEITGVTGLADAVGKHAVVRQEKRAFYRRVKEAAHALSELDVKVDDRLAGMGFHRKIAAAQKVRTLEKHASASDLDKVEEVRRTLDQSIFDDLIKSATILSSVAENPLARALGKGLLGGTGAAVPLYFAGNAIAENNAEEMRNKALQTAAGVGLIGLGTYGAGRGMAHLAKETERDNQAARSVDMQRAMLANTLAANQAMKYSSAGPDGKTDLTKKEDTLDKAKGKDWLTKTEKQMPGGEVKMEMEEGKVAELMRVVYIDQFLDQVDQTEKVAEIRELNRDYGVTLLCELEKEAAMKVVQPMQAEMVRPPEGSVDPLKFFEKDAAAYAPGAQIWNTYNENREALKPFADQDAVLARSGPYTQRSSRNRNNLWGAMDYPWGEEGYIPHTFGRAHRQRDLGLTQQLMRQQHTRPFEHHETTDYLGRKAFRGPHESLAGQGSMAAEGVGDIMQAETPRRAAEMTALRKSMQAGAPAKLTALQSALNDPSGTIARLIRGL